MSVVTDLQQRAFTYCTCRLSNEEGAEWDEAVWDEAEWASDVEAINQWQGVNSYGAAVSLRVEGKTKNAAEFKFLSADAIYEKAIGI